jgi:hypothetical protein
MALCRNDQTSERPQIFVSRKSHRFAEYPLLTPRAIAAVLTVQGSEFSVPSDCNVRPFASAVLHDHKGLVHGLLVITNKRKWTYMVLVMPQQTRTPNPINALECAHRCMNDDSAKQWMF